MRFNTFLGILAILFWGANVAFQRTVAEQVGPITAGALAFMLAGLLGCLYFTVTPGSWRSFARLPRPYLLGCGLLFVVNAGTLNLSVGFSHSRAQVLTVALINYLWPALSLLLAVPLLGKRASPWLPAGIAAALAGIALATLEGDLAGWLPGLIAPQNALVYGLALAAALTWGLYSNLARRWAADAGLGGAPVFLLATGLALAGLRAFFPEPWRWTASAGRDLALLVIFPSLLAYFFWDLAMRRGNLVLVASLSFFIPVLSTIISGLMLRVPVQAHIWAGAALVTVGAVVCNLSVKEAEGEASIRLSGG